MIDGLSAYGLWGLLLASFLAATVLPFSSELVLATLIASGMDIVACIIFATIGNSLGGATCYYLGMLGKVDWLEKWFKIKPAKIIKMQSWLKGKGAVMGFLGFLPAIGDLILVSLGFMRSNIHITMITMTIGKLFRYIIIGYSAGALFS